MNVFEIVRVTVLNRTDRLKENVQKSNDNNIRIIKYIKQQIEHRYKYKYMFK